MSLKNCIKRSKMRVFRRAYMKMRQANGEYESTWTQIPSKYIKKWGQVKFDSDIVKPNFYSFGDFSMDVLNNDGYFSGTDNAVSIWYGAPTRYRTLIKINAGYVDLDDSEYPTTSTLFVGILTDDLKQNYDNIVQLQARHISEVFKEIMSTDVAGIGSTQTASDIIDKIKSYSDSSGTLIFQKYFSAGAWNIAVTTNNYNLATSGSLDGLSCWELMTKLAEAENHVLYISREGDFYFQPRAAISSVASFHFSGLGGSNPEYGHNVMKQINIDDGISRVYNRVRVKIGDGDTTTSYVTKKETWNWGDSSSSFYYGVRIYDMENIWMNTVTATTVADTIYNEFVWPKLEITMETKFVPHLNLFDRVSLTYRTRTPMGGDLWGYFDWGAGVWAAQAGYNINISDTDYQLIGLAHNLDTFKSSVKLRGI